MTPEDDDIHPEEIRASIVLRRARGERWKQTEDGGYQRVSSLAILAERGLISSLGLSGAQSYRLDYLASIEDASMRCTLYARSGARDDEGAVQQRAFSASAILARVQRDVLTDRTVRRLVDELCGRDGSSPSLEVASIRHDIPRHLERVGEWYGLNEVRCERDHDEQAMRLVALEEWWLLAQAFSPGMTRAAFYTLFEESGMAAEQASAAARRKVAASKAERLRPMLNEVEAEHRAKRLFSDFATRFRLRATEWRLLPEGEKRRWRDAAQSEQGIAA